jgi:predicted O-linked N-acetylglucosamine transferase (SPINDLY family)
MGEHVNAMEFSQTLSKAIEHLQAGRLAEAEALLNQALAAQPDHPDALHLLGCAASKAGRPTDAVRLIRKAIAADPAQSVFHNNLGLALLMVGDKLAAIQAFRAAIALNPDSPDSYHHLGITLCDLGEFAQAIECFNQAVSRWPHHALSHYNLGNCWAKKGAAIPPGGDAAQRQDHLQKAIGCFRRALELRPDYGDAGNNLANALREAGRMDEAIEVWRRTAASGSHFFAGYNLGRALYERDLLDESLLAIQKALRINPKYSDAYNNLGNVFRQAGQSDHAISQFDRAIQLDPQAPAAQSNRLYTLSYSPSADAERLLREHQNWNDGVVRRWGESIRPHENDRSPNRRLKIGYVSPNFWGHCQFLFTSPLFSNHRHDEFEIHCYSDVKTPDEFTARLRGWADVWRNIAGMNDDQAAELIRRDKIDILVDLTLHMAENRMLLFARKPAPVQVTWLGYPGTTGLTTMDYRLTDPYLDPPGETDRFYTEKSLRLPHTFWCIDAQALDSPDFPAVNALPALSAGGITFGCLNNFCKVNQPLLELWKRVLDAVPGSTMRMRAPAGSCRKWVSQTLGDRVDFVDRASRMDYLRYFNHVDLSLDTLPYNGHTTTLDSLWMGVPAVTMIGQTVVGRAGLSQLSNLGLTRFVADSPDRFVELAQSAAADLPALSELRRTLRDRMRASPLMDAPRFARDIEWAYRAIWREWCEGRPEIRNQKSESSPNSK